MNARWLKYLPLFLRERLEGRHRLQAIVSNSGWLFADRVLRMGVALVVSVWLARYLGPERFGQFNFALAFVAIFGVFATLGLDSIVVRELVRNPQQKDEILGSAFLLKLMGGAVAFLASVGAIYVFRPEDMNAQLLVGIIALGAVFQVFDTADLWFQSQVRSKYTVIARNFSFVVFACVKVGLILTHANLAAFAWTITGEVALSAMGLAIAYKVTGNDWLHLGARCNRMAFLLRESWPLVFSGLAVTLYLRVDQIMLAEMAGANELGQYSAAIRLSEVWYMIPAVIVGSVMPSVTKARNVSWDLYMYRLKQLFTHLSYVAYFVAILISAFSSALIHFIYGNDFSGAGPILSIHIWAALFVFMGVARGIYTVNEGVNKVVMIGTVCGAIINIGLNLVLIPRYGGLGAGIATTISYGISDVFFYKFIPSCKPIYRLMLQSITLGIVKTKG